MWLRMAGAVAAALAASGGWYWFERSESALIPLAAAAAPAAQPAAPPQALGSSEQPEPDAQLQAIAAQIAAAQSALAQLRREVAALGARVSAGSAQREDHATPSRDAAALAEAEQLQSAQHALRETAFAGEREERAWARRASAALREAAQFDEALSGAVRELTCRSQTCRLELAELGGEGAKLMPYLLHQLADELPEVVAFPLQGADGSNGTVLFLSRGATAPARP